MSNLTRYYFVKRVPELNSDQVCPLNSEFGDLILDPALEGRAEAGADVDPAS